MVVHSVEIDAKKYDKAYHEKHTDAATAESVKSLFTSVGQLNRDSEDVLRLDRLRELLAIHLK